MAPPTQTNLNVNSRYTIESIAFACRIRNELRAHQVTFRLTRGGAPELVRVLLAVDKALIFSILQFRSSTAADWRSDWRSALALYIFRFNG